MPGFGENISPEDVTRGIKDIEEYLKDEARPPMMKKVVYGLGKALVYLTGGFGGGYLLVQIQEMEERDKPHGSY